MKLTFKQPYLSIKHFPTTEIEGFVLLTGQNGVGKSHLLQALFNGSIQVHGLTAELGIALFTSETLIPNPAQPFSSAQFEGEIQNRINLIAGHQKQLLDKMKSLAAQLSLPASFVADPFKMFESSAREELAAKGIVCSPELVGRFDQIVRSCEQQFFAGNNLNNTAEGAYFRHVANEQKKSVLMLTAEDFNDPRYLSWSNASPFQQQISRIFVQYNKTLQAAIIDAHYQSKKFSTEDFEKEHVPPWKFLEEAFEAAELPFEITRPPRKGDGHFTPKLIKKDSKDEVLFESLSSGEKTIMSFALCLYQTSDRRINITFPRLLLLDEIDAHLHPAMVKNILATILDVLVAKHGVTVVATTHSPTTVALAPEESIYEMRRNEIGIRRISKISALNVLTEGVPALGISFEGKRQVFVESPQDADLHALVYKYSRSYTKCSNKLYFLSTGFVADSGDVNTGCAKVIELVRTHRDSGNTTVWGLVDWDRVNQPSDRVTVLAHGRRYSIENLIFDPLLLLATCLLDWEVKQKLVEKIPESEALNQSDLNPADSQAVNEVVEKLQTQILGISDLNDPISVSNCQGDTYKVDRAFLELNGHDLESKILSFLPILSSHRFTKKGLLRHIVNVTMKEFHGLIPVEFTQAYSAICQAPQH